MTYVDAALLNVVERLCRRFQVWTGRSNVWLGFQLINLSIAVYFVWVIDLYVLSADAGVRTFVAIFCGGVFFMLTRTIFRTPVDFAEQQAYRRAANKLANPRRLRDIQLRITFLTLSIVLSYPIWFVYRMRHSRFVVLTEALILLTTVVLYVLACDPLPPCAGKIKEWVRGLAQARRATAAAEP